MNGLIDMHCHIVPKVDDGAQSMKGALRILHQEYKAGVRKIILTPHYRLDMFETPRDEVEERFFDLQDAAAEYFDDLELYLGCEYHAHTSMMKDITADPRYRMNGGDHILVEFATQDTEKFMESRIYDVLSYGFIPIIAHAERYEAVRRSPDLAAELADMGAEIQVNADSVIGTDGFFLGMYCRKLIKNGIVTYIGSDAHNTKDRACHLAECRQVLTKKFGEETAERLLITNPAKILR